MRHINLYCSGTRTGRASVVEADCSDSSSGTHFRSSIDLLRQRVLIPNMSGQVAAVGSTVVVAANGHVAARRRKEDTDHGDIIGRQSEAIAADSNSGGGIAGLINDPAVEHITRGWGGRQVDGRACRTTDRVSTDGAVGGGSQCDIIADHKGRAHRDIAVGHSKLVVRHCDIVVAGILDGP